MLSQRDFEQIEKRGSSKEVVISQLEYFKLGFPNLNIVSPATPGRGVKILNREEQLRAIELYSRFKGNICKFVPASGAATRMFKDLFEILNNKHRDAELQSLDISKFPFYDEIPESLIKGDKRAVIEYLLSEKGLGYGSLPKGLIKFHKYGNVSKTPFEEHLAEGGQYAVSGDGICRISFTVSPEHLDKFKYLLNRVKSLYEEMFGCKYDVSFSIQKPSTDTIAATITNEPFRDRDGNLVFRPGGHGALIENLNDIDAHIIIIKNIDNICREELREDTIWWKKVLAGKLLETQDRIFNYIRCLKGSCDSSLVEEIKTFFNSELSIELPNVPEAILKDYLIEKLNRPIRVCGMVVNTGEPGGGPYIVKDSDGSTSLQILESAQLNTEDNAVKEMITKSTHFNPVDIVCSFKTFNGCSFDLTKYIDKETGFITSKSIEGELVKALELPGLWNGAMSQWNTLFVEVPVTTFSPVKTVFDLLRPEHSAD